jgi:RNA polymerase sigma-70 factor (ECF subfamily)
MEPEEWSQRSDIELVIAALVGNLEAFGELVKRFRPAVRSVVSGIVHSPESAEDIVQDTFLLAFKALPQLRDVDSFASWLHAIARNRAIRYQERANRTVPRSTLDMFILQESRAFDGDPANNPATMLEQEESWREIRDALDQLPEEYQVVLRLRYWSEMPLQRMTEFLAMPLSVVKWRIYKGKQLLKERLERRWKEDDQWPRKRN